MENLPLERIQSSAPATLRSPIREAYKSQQTLHMMLPAAREQVSGPGVLGDETCTGSWRQGTWLGAQGRGSLRWALKEESALRGAERQSGLQS